MNLTISPYRYSIKSKPAFKANEGDTDGDSKLKEIIEKQKEPSEIGCSGAGCLISTAAVVACCGIVFHLSNKDLQKELEKFSNGVDSITKSDEIRKDTFTVTDVNEDESPEMILYKKDGGRVVLDIKNGKILEEKTTFEEIE